MALTLGTNSGFCAAAPTADPAVTAFIIKEYTRAQKHVAPSGATAVTEIGWYVSGTGFNDVNWECGVYDHDGTNNRPGNLLTGYSQTNATGTTTDIWAKRTGLNIAVTAGQTYWIAVQVDQNGPSCDRGSVTGAIYASVSSVSTLPGSGSASWSMTDANLAFAIYAVYSTGSSIVIPVFMNQYRQRRR